MPILVDIIHSVEFAALFRSQLLTDAVDVGDGLDDLACLFLVVVVFIDFGFKLLLQLCIHASNMRYVCLQTRDLLLLLKQFFLHLGKRFPLESSHTLHLIVYHLFALFQFFVLVLEVDKAHADPVHVRVTGLTEVLVLGHVLKEDRKLLVV